MGAGGDGPARAVGIGVRGDMFGIALQIGLQPPPRRRRPLRRGRELKALLVLTERARQELARETEPRRGATRRARRLSHSLARLPERYPPEPSPPHRLRFTSQHLR